MTQATRIRICALGCAGIVLAGLIQFMTYEPLTHENRVARYDDTMWVLLPFFLGLIVLFIGLGYQRRRSVSIPLYIAATLSIVCLLAIPLMKSSIV